MQLIRGLHNLSPFEKGCVATIGNFDGVHVGHQDILRRVTKVAREKRVPSVAMVFEPQPREYFSRGSMPARLMRFREKLSHLAYHGVDVVLCLQFNERLRSLSADAFIGQILVNQLRLQHLVVGDDFRFGCDRKGNFAMLKAAGARAGFTVENTRTIEVAGERVSSTRIREALDAHDLALAEQLLGYPYSITGVVVHGQKLGRTIGVPTANVSLGRKVPALNGVFAVTAQEVPKGDYRRVAPEGPAWQGVANIGLRPTVNGHLPALEVHLFDFDGRLYGKHIRVSFLRWLREEARFSSLNALKAQIALDIRSAREFFEQSRQKTTRTELTGRS